MNYRLKLREIQLESTDPEAFWHRINGLVKEKKITQHILAETIGVEYPRLRGWSHRKYYPSVNQIYAIAQALDTTVEYLIFGAQEPVNKNSQIIGESLIKLIKLIIDGLN